MRTSLILFTLTTALLWGCATSTTIRPLPGGDSQTLNRGEPVVLYRIAAEIGTQIVTHPPYQFELIDSATNIVKSVRVFSPSQKAKDAGWGYLFVEPGVHRLTLTFRFFGYPSADFQLQVRPEEHIVYVGSLSIRCRREPLLLWVLTTDCSDIAVSNEARDAEVIAGASFATRRPMSIQLLSRAHER